MLTAKKSLAAAFALAALAACSDDPERAAPAECKPACGSNAYCNDGACACSPGFVGNPKTACVRAVKCAEDTCKHGTCDDSTGVPVCSCASGWTGDDCGTCAPGTILVDGACIDDPCLPDPCGGHGTCAATAAGTAECTCTGNRTGADCGECADGYRLSGDACVADPCAAEDCSGHGACNVEQDRAVCACSTGYTGTACGACADGYVESPASSGTCVEDGCAGIDCGHGTCKVLGGDQTTCECATGYEGATCKTCATGHLEFPAGSGTCIADACAGANCGHGTCRVSGAGQKTCDCATGYAGDACAACAQGYIEFPAGSGTCVTDPCVGASCGHGTCRATSATEKACDCATGYTGPACATCAQGYVETPAGSGTCVSNLCAGVDCGHGTCKLNGTQTSCECATGYTGAACNSCAQGYIESPAGSGTCSADPCAGNTCSGHGTCAVEGAAAKCTCATGYAGAACNSCATGYVELPVGSGTCVANSCAGVTCTGATVCNAAGTAEVRTTGNCLVTGADSHQCEVVDAPCTAGPCVEGACRSAAAAGELAIVEVMVAPAAVTAEKGQWIEVYNKANKKLSLAGLKLKVGTTTVTLPAATANELASGSYLVIGRNADRATNGDVAVQIAAADLPTIAAGSAIELRSADGQTLIDAVSLQDTWQRSGFSLTLSPAALTGATATLNDNKLHWCLAQGSDKASPGRVNDPCVLNWCNVQSPATLADLVAGAASPKVYGQAYEPELTNASDHTPFIKAQLGLGATGTQPGQAWTWVDAAYNPAFTAQNNEEFMASFTAVEGTRDYAYRMSLDDGLTWTVCDTDGSENGYTTDKAGKATATGAAGPDKVFFSEYIEGSSNNKALEIFNGNAAPFDLSGCKINMYFNGSSTAGNTSSPLVIPANTPALAPGEVFVVCHPSSAAGILNVCDHKPTGPTWFNGNDAVALECGGTVLDVFGQIGFDPGNSKGWGNPGTHQYTMDKTLRRKCAVTAGDTDGSDTFAPATEWDGWQNDTFSGLGSHVCQ